jgi:hypothetical protein
VMTESVMTAPVMAVSVMTASEWTLSVMTTLMTNVGDDHSGGYDVTDLEMSMSVVTVFVMTMCHIEVEAARVLAGDRVSDRERDRGVGGGSQMQVKGVSAS